MIIGLFVGAVVLIGFVLVELRSHEPMMDVRLFSDRYDVAIPTFFVVLFCIYGMMPITTQYLQNVRDYEPAQAGIAGVYTLPVMILSPIAGAFVAAWQSPPDHLGAVLR